MLLLAMALLVITTGIAVSQLVAHRYSASLLAAAAARAENVAHKLSLDAADRILINDRIAVQKMLDDQIISDPAVAYIFIVRQGELLAHTFAEGTPVHLIAANTPESGESGHIEKIVSQDGARFIDVAWPIFGGQAGTLRLGLAEAPYRQAVRKLWIQMSAITLGILVVALGVGRWMINRLTRPLGQLAEYAGRIDEGSLDTRIAVGGREEVARLASAFNSMLARLKEYTSRLKESNVQLEQKNLELDRAHRQLETSFSISQQIAALPRLDQICHFLITTLRQVVECRNLNLMAFNTAIRTINLATPQETHHLGPEHYDALYDEFNRHKALAFIRVPDIERLGLSEWMGRVDQIALFPIRHHDLLIGAMLVACTGDCRCVRHELDVVAITLHHAAGAIHRANGHEDELRALRQRIDADAGYQGIIGRDPKMQVIFRLIDDVAPTDATVLIHGESGTGKELVARAIHERSPRAQNPFVVINCSAYPSTLLESELFGHEKGAFTGALKRKIGRFEQADGGTVFLDEIGEIEPAAQTKLLRVLQQQTIDRLGGERSIRVDVRILAATNKNLIEEVRLGRFREDLFYRLNVIPIQLPPLRERPKDIHLLARHFLNRFAREQGKPITGFRSEAMRKLIDAPWPGNVRELENSIEHAVVLAKGTEIELRDLPTAIIEAERRPPEHTFGATINETEERLIREVLEACQGNKAEAARQLGISRSTLYEKIKKLQPIKTARMKG